ncbi:DUF2188 domain-containing protein [Aquisalinus flavus]|uniref:DUF2188 domain-containing protein n=1 Tax=Aquisalinus flavus TaxID=1526572 RepID=A0A8J2Y6B8_9PROT|nr:DUF2188 domain-containing protein [Aquisalinus flavus]MBD0427427.1 DUF2188 domain-containing protein [Aquisalinus flavus]UNE47230.1 DUF2188 domain-containing protein [Aquisalinus flavus]GGD00912.1 hypothetical protein GCM10011342_07410 [Aquisalinus flavus]
MALDKYEIVYRSDSRDWALVKEGADRASLVASKKQAIMAKMKKMMNRDSNEASVRVKKRNGQYQEERTYPRAKDPSRSKG